MIELKHLTKHFETQAGTVAALEDISLSIADGDIFGVIGMSGAGKSTLVRCINLLERPDSGSVVVNGQDMQQLSPAALRAARRDIAMIFQQFNLLMQRTCLKNICFPLELAGRPKAEAEARARQLLELVGLPDKADAYPAQLSGGQKQRIAIARALATDPKVLLCDEATSALDPNTTHSILQLIQQINRELGITVVVITHQMSVVEDICRHVAILDGGRVVEQGDVARDLLQPQNRRRPPAGVPRRRAPQRGRPAAGAADGAGGFQRHPYHRQTAGGQPGHRVQRPGLHCGGGHPRGQRPDVGQHAAGPAGGRGRGAARHRVYPGLPRPEL